MDVHCLSYANEWAQKCGGNASQTWLAQGLGKAGEEEKGDEKVEQGREGMLPGSGTWTRS